MHLWRSAGKADPAIKQQIEPAVLEERSSRCTANIERLAKVIEDASLDALIIIGDDQNEQFADDNMPAILIYWGNTIENNPLHMEEDAPAFWRKARSQYHVEGETKDYPVASELALHIIKSLIACQFDVSHSKRLTKDHGEGHAFGFVHQRLMPNKIVPIVPVALNTYFPPNQPTPKRCYDLGKAIRNAVHAMPGNGRIGILASGGLSHFTVDEELDRLILDASKRKRCRSADIDPNEPAEFRHIGGAQLAYCRGRLRTSFDRLAGIHPVLSFTGGHGLRNGFCGLEMTRQGRRHFQKLICWWL